MILLEKLNIMTPLQKLPKTAGDLSKLKKVAQSPINRPIWSHWLEGRMARVTRVRSKSCETMVLPNWPLKYPIFTITDPQDATTLAQVIYPSELVNNYWQLIAPLSTADFSGKVGINLELSLVTSYAVIRLHVEYLHTVGWGEGPRAFMTPPKAIRLGVGVYKKLFEPV